MIATFMTFNIQSCHNYHTREIDIDLMAETIQSSRAEIIGLNEVYGADPDQAEEIAKRLGYPYHYFGQAIIHRDRPYGNAIISKLPWKEIETIPIPDPVRDTDEYYESRVVIRARFEKPDFTLITTHFGLAKSEQVNAMRTVLSLLDEVKTPIVLMGDFNMVPDDAKIRPLFERLHITYNPKIPSFPSVSPQRRIDYIFVSPDIEVIAAAIVSAVASDHLPHLAVLNIPE
ncbi:MAG TPA: hypothetical protein GX390_04030 [Acholeplasmataceae bacterium]|jgi:endonuclease/exonuclease/phosphatase family metal-dependent hydrolase|nr:hypothetical protein [Acholeplasmataceae bacterium]